MKNLFTCTTSTHTSQKCPEQRREQHLSRMCSSSGVWSSGVGDPLGPHVLQVSVQAPAVLLQYPCVSPMAQKKQPVRTHTQDRHPLIALGLQQKPSVGLFPVKNHCIIILQATQDPKAASSPACVRVRGEALVSALRPESLHRPAVDLGGWGGSEEEWEESPMCVYVGGGWWTADLDT